MNFFEQQDQSRRQSRWLIFLFVLAVLAIIIVVDVVMLISLGLLNVQENVALFSLQNVQANGSLLLTGAVATAGLIGFASVFKTLSLRGGGGEVARSLGGIQVEPDTRDPLKRRLVNVVEEIALAAGVPVPEIYVLDREAGINAFAAGYSPADAAVAVTRGTLEKLDRSELQGVVAHEFSHILNGDMRLNIRLMGALFGILLLSIIGRKVLYHSSYMGRSRNNAGLGIMGIALTLLVVGWIGQLFGRAIKAAVSRQREYLADASAVQFTRDPEGVAGALKKIAVHSHSSYLLADTEEVGHMLFGPGRMMNAFATHPPLMKRITAIEPTFHKDDLIQLAQRMKRHQQRQAEKAAREQQEQERKPGIFDAERIIDQIGNPDMQQILLAAALAESIPQPVSHTARRVESAPEALLYTVLHPEADIREAQLLSIAQEMGGDAEQQVRNLVNAAGVLGPGQRLPLLEIALPSLHRQPPELLKALLKTVDLLIKVDGHVDMFEYLLARIIRQYLWESVNPHKVRPAGKRSLSKLAPQVRQLLAIFAHHGHEDKEAAENAYAAGVEVVLPGDREPAPQVQPWIDRLDAALNQLDQLTPEHKQQLVRAMLTTTTHDGQLVVEELELMRAACAAIHVPIPALQGVAGADPKA